MFQFRFIAICFVLVGIAYPAAYADTVTDSIEANLNERLKANLRDQGTVEVLKDLSHRYFSSNPLKGIEYAEQAMTIAKEMESLESQADIFNYFGNFYRDQGLLDLAMEAHLNSVEISEHIADTARLAYALNDLGNIYYDQKDLDKALEIYRRAADLALAIKRIDALPVSYNNMGLVFHLKKDYDMAFSYFAKALKYREEQGESELVGHSFNYIGMVYRSQGNFRLATEYFGKALSKFKAIDHKLLMGDTYLAIGVNYAMQKDYATAFECFAKAEENFLSQDNKIELSHLYLTKGKYQFENEMYAEAKANFQKASLLSDENGFRGLKKQVLLMLSQTEDKLGNYQAAYETYKLYTSLKDSLSNNEINNKIIRLEAAYSYRQKEKELAIMQKETAYQQEKLHAQKLKFKFLIAFLVGLISLVLLVIALKLTPNQRKKVLSEIRARVALFLH